MSNGCNARTVWRGEQQLSWLLLAVTGLFLLFSLSVGAQEIRTLEKLTSSPTSTGQVQLVFTFSGPAPTPGTFTIENPAQLSIDLPNTRLGDIPRSQVLGTGLARNVRVVEAGGRTRAVVNLSRLVPYDVRTQDNILYVTLQAAPQQTTEGVGTAAAAAPIPATSQVTNIDFRRADKGTGRILVTLSDPSVIVDVQTRGDNIVVDFMSTNLPETLQRRLDVTDFATPVTTIDAFSRDGVARLVIAPQGLYEHLAYQVGNTYTIDIKPLTKEEKAALTKDEYTGERLSLNFQNIDIRAVLQLIGDFTGLNIVASDTVQGNVTLRLKNVPWDQALDIILKSKGLGMRRNGNVVMIAPSEEIAAREKLELEARQQLEELAPLRTEFFQVNYAKAVEIAALIKAEENSLLSKRGSVTIDERTNTMMIQDTGDKLDEIRGVIARLDIPVRQVLIESRIVIANDDYSKNLGARFGVTYTAKNGNAGLATTTGSAIGSNTTVSSGLSNLANTGQTFPVTAPSLNDRLNVNLPVLNPAGQIALAVLGSDYIVDLELSALQSEGKGEVVSSPRVITANQKAAVIEQGVEIPYLQASSSGATTVAFKKAVLSLSVTPQITPDNRVNMDLKVNKDSVGEIFVGVPSINTRAVETQVLVNNGDTVVLGGIYEQTRSDEVTKVPLLGDLPVLGALFRQTITVDDKAELLIFVTPKILKEGLSTGL